MRMVGCWLLVCLGAPGLPAKLPGLGKGFAKLVCGREWSAPRVMVPFAAPQAEVSFHELLESLDVLRSPGSAPSPAADSSRALGVGSAPPVAAAVSGLQVRAVQPSRAGKTTCFTVSFPRTLPLSNVPGNSMICPCTQATLQALEADNGAVQGSLQRTRQAMSGVQSELNRVRTGTGAAGGSPAQQPQPTHSVP